MPKIPTFSAYAERSNKSLFERTQKYSFSSRTQQKCLLNPNIITVFAQVEHSNNVCLSLTYLYFLLKTNIAIILLQPYILTFFLKPNIATNFVQAKHCNNFCSSRTLQQCLFKPNMATIFAQAEHSNTFCSSQTQHQFCFQPRTNKAKALFGRTKEHFCQQRSNFGRTNKDISSVEQRNVLAQDK